MYFEFHQDQPEIDNIFKCCQTKIKHPDTLSLIEIQEQSDKIAVIYSFKEKKDFDLLNCLKSFNNKNLIEVLKEKMAKLIKSVQFFNINLT